MMFKDSFFNLKYFFFKYKEGLRSGSTYFISNIINSIIPFVALAFFSRVLTPSEFGQVNVFQSIVVFVSAFIGLSTLGSISIQYFKLDRDKLAAYIGTILLIMLASVLFIIIIVLLFESQVQVLTKISIRWVFLTISIGLSQFIIQLRLLLWQFSGEVKNYALYLISQTLINAVLSTILIYAFAFHEDGRFWGIAISSYIFAILSFYNLYNAEFIKFNWYNLYAINSLKFGIPVVFQTLGGNLFVLGTVFIVNSKLSPGDVAIFSIPNQICYGFLVYVDSINKVYHPKLVSLSMNDYNKANVVMETYRIMAINFFVAILFAIFATAFFPYYIGKQYESGRFLIPLFIVAHFFTSLYYLTAIFINVANKNWYLTLSSLLSSTIGLLIIYFFISDFGIICVAISSIFTQLFLFILSWLSSNLVYPLPWFKFLK
jgi:O-antigen/teichoic acid export membrane protein